MTSDRKVNANRANARASTGPRTDQGRARTAQNALRHALSLPISATPELSRDVEALAREIAGFDGNAVSFAFARQIAEAQIDLRRVRYARHQLLSNATSAAAHNSRANMRRAAKVLGRLRPNAPDMSLVGFGELLTSTVQGPHNLATVLSQEAKRLLAMDRYERRAWSRRKVAIRAFDACGESCAKPRE